MNTLLCSLNSKIKLCIAADSGVPSPFVCKTNGYVSTLPINTESTDSITLITVLKDDMYSDATYVTDFQYMYNDYF